MTKPIDDLLREARQFELQSRRDLPNEHMDVDYALKGLADFVRELADALERLQSKCDTLQEFSDAHGGEVERLHDALERMRDERRIMELRLKSLEGEVEVARERLGPAGWKVLERASAMKQVVEAARSVASEEDVRWLLCCYTQGVRLLELLGVLDKADGEEKG